MGLGGLGGLWGFEGGRLEPRVKADGSLPCGAVQNRCVLIFSVLGETVSCYVNTIACCCQFTSRV